MKYIEQSIKLKKLQDEIVFLDITASYENRNIKKEYITESESKLSIPLTVGGGITSIQDFREILKCGADKISINSSAVKNPELIKIVANEFGTQCVVVAIDGKRDEKGNFKVFIKGGRENTGLDVLDWVKKCEELGAGEILNCDATLIAGVLHYGEITIEQIKNELYKNNISVRRLIKD